MREAFLEFSLPSHSDKILRANLKNPQMRAPMKLRSEIPLLTSSGIDLHWLLDLPHGVHGTGLGIGLLLSAARIVPLVVLDLHRHAAGRPPAPRNGYKPRSQQRGEGRHTSRARGVGGGWRQAQRAGERRHGHRRPGCARRHGHGRKRAGERARELWIRNNKPWLGDALSLSLPSLITQLLKRGSLNMPLEHPFKHIFLCLPSYWPSAILT